MEAKVRFMGATEGVAGAPVGAVVDGEGGGYVEALAMLSEGLQILGEELVGEVGSGVLFAAGEESLVGTVSTPDEGFSSLSGLDMVWADFRVEWEDFLGSVVMDGDLANWDGGAEETGEGGVCLGEGPSRTGPDPWVLTGVGVDGKSFSILKGLGGEKSESK